MTGPTVPAKGWVRWRANCPRCDRSTAVTFNKRTGEAYLRSHNDPASGLRCTLSGQTVDRGLLR